MAKTDKPKKDGSGAKKSKAKDLVLRQPLGEKGTFASKTPTLQTNTRGKKKGSKAKPKQPQAAPPEDRFEVCENIQSDCFLPISDIDSVEKVMENWEALMAEVALKLAWVV